MASPACSARRLWGSLLLSLSIAALAPTAMRAQRQSVPQVGESGPISPTVVAASSARVDSSGDALLDFLVLLRGEPGWFLPVKSSASSGSGSFQLVIDGEARELRHAQSRLEFSVDDRTLRLQFDPAAQTLTIQTEVVSLEAANVVVMDGADSAAGPYISALFRVDSRLPGPGPHLVESVVRELPELWAFLGCDAVPRDAYARRVFDALPLCARLRPE